MSDNLIDNLAMGSFKIKGSVGDGDNGGNDNSIVIEKKSCDNIFTVDFDCFIADRCKDDCFVEDVLSVLPKDKFIVGGGAVRDLYCFNNKIPNDIDLFFRNEDDYFEVKKAIEESYSTAKFKNSSDFNTTYECASLNKDGTIDFEVKIQLIKAKWYKDIKELFESFDFTLCQFATDFKKIYFAEHSVKDAISKKIVVNNIEYPVSSFRRYLKYISQGYYACGGSMKEFLLQTRYGNFSGNDFDVEYID